MFIISLKMIEALKIPENNDSRAPCLDTLSSRRRSKSGIQPAQEAKCLPLEAMHRCNGVFTDYNNRGIIKEFEVSHYAALTVWRKR